MGKSKNTYIILIVAGLLSLILRIYFLFKPGYSFDIGCFLDWGGRIKSDGFWSLFGGDYYQNNSGIDYPPLVPLLCSWWFSLVGNTTTFYYKVLPTIFEVGIIAISSFFVIKSNYKYKNLLLAIVIVQPALALVTSAWGQVDSIMSLLIIVGFLFWEKNLYLASSFLFLAFLSKPQAVIAIFIYFVCLFFKNKKDFLKQVVFWIVIFILMTIIFRFFGNSNLFDPYIRSVGRYTNLSLNAFNLWWLLYGSEAWNIQDSTGPYKVIGLFLFAVFEIPVIIYAIKKKIDFSSLILLTSYSYLLFFVFPTQIHERYLFPAIAMLAIQSVASNLITSFYIVLTATFFYNCFAVLESVYPQFVYVSENLLQGFAPRIASFINVVSVIFFAYFVIYEAFRKNKQK